MRQGQHFLRAVAFAVQEKFHGIEVRVHPYRDRFAFALIPVPVRKQMEHGLGTPPCLIVIKIVLGKTAHIHNAKLRVDGRPGVGRGLAAIVESGPGKASGQPFPCGVKLPPLLGEFRPRSMIQVVGAYPVTQLVGRINASRGNGAGRLRANAGLFRMLLVPVVWDVQIVVKSHHIQRVGEV